MRIRQLHHLRAIGTRRGRGRGRAVRTGIMQGNAATK